jgi:hypothetical protein
VLDRNCCQWRDLDATVVARDRHDTSTICLAADRRTAPSPPIEHATATWPVASFAKTKVRPVLSIAAAGGPAN